MTAEVSGRRPRFLLLVPILPAPSGNGLAMRAGVFLDALAGSFSVTVWVVPLAGGRLDDADPWVRERSERIVIAPLEVDPLWRLLSQQDEAARATAANDYPRPALARFATAPAIGRLAAALPIGVRFDASLTMRSYLAPFVLPLLREDGLVRGNAVLDFDDDEAVTRRRLADLLESMGERAAAEAERADAGKFEAFERALLPAFDRLLVGHEGHARELCSRAPGARVEVVPNAIAMPERAPAGAPAPLARERGGEPGELRLLLVGNLGYLPNQDAVHIASREILPRLAAQGRAVRLRVVGSAPPPAIRALASPAVEVHADVLDVAPHYAWADVALAPIRAGGGTRIKLLEAFAHRVPMVATPIAAEGLEVENGRHLLMAERTDELAAACLRLDRDPELRRRVVDEAFALVESRYERGVVAQRIGELFRR